MRALRALAALLLSAGIVAATTSGAIAEVATHGSEETPERPIVVIEVNSITDDDNPLGFWTPHSGDSANVHPLNPPGAENGDGRPSVVVHPATRVPMVAWPRRTATGFDIVVSRFEGGAWTVPQVVAAGDGGTADAHLTVDPASGDVHLFYRTGGATPRIEHRSASSAASAWSAPTTVSLPGEIAARPSATWHDGRLWIAYEVHLGAFEDASRQIVIAVHDGLSWQGEVVGAVQYDRPNEPELHSDGRRLWVDWIDAAGVMRWTTLEADGGWGALAQEPFAGVEDREYHVRGRIKRAVRER